MKQLTYWDPFRELDGFSSLLGNRCGQRQDATSWTQTDWTPAVDIVEDRKGYVISAELPQVDKNDVSLTVENGVLTLQGERTFEKTEDDKEQKVHRVERAYGSFTRSFRVPTDADGSKITASYKDGVLQVTLPKSEEAAPKAIRIEAN